MYLATMVSFWQIPAKDKGIRWLVENKAIYLYNLTVRVKASVIGFSVDAPFHINNFARGLVRSDVETPALVREIPVSHLTICLGTTRTNI